MEHHDVELDHCARCGGTFLDPGEETEIFGIIASPDVWKKSSVSKSLGSSKLKCPADNRKFDTYAVKFGDQHVKIDLCPYCSGMWLDPGEGKKLRDIVITAG